MKNSGKIIAGGVITAAILAWTVFRAKKNYKKLSAEEVICEETHAVKGAVIVPENACLVKDLIREVWNEEGDDVVVIDDIITGKVQNVLHIKERFDDRLGRNVVELLFQVPENIYRKGRGMGEFVEQVRGKWDPESEELVGESFIGKITSFMEKYAGEQSPSIVKSSVEGYVYGTWKDEDVVNKAMVSVSKNTYEHNYMNPEHTRVTEWVADLNSELQKGEKSVLETTHGNYFTPIRAIACVKVIIDGLTLEAARAIVKDCLAGEFKVQTSAGNYTFDRFLFYDPNGVNEQTVFEVIEEEGSYTIASTDLVDEIGSIDNEEETRGNLLESAGIDADALKEAIA